MERLEPLYFCLECKKVVPSVQSLLFIEERSNKGFCTESCIEKFYGPIVQHFDHYEREKRIKLSIENENLDYLLDDLNLMNKALYGPDEVWELKNSFGESIFSQIKSIDNIYIIVLCFTYHNRPSFIINTVITESKSLMAAYQIGARQTLSRSSINPHLYSYLKNKITDNALLNKLENKKNDYLSDLLKLKERNDFSTESYSYYEQNLKDTLEAPDEVYKKENNGDVLYTYVKSYIDTKSKSNYFYYVLCLDLEPKSGAGMESVHPFFAFPSKSHTVYEMFRNGELLVGNFKN